ncbi:unnamed protein product [marine sediment metagenome]|uniref:Uncharacterized protein n=1 Tax=marine sediment metagenome TaxID=412755 RepID=X1HRF8_9ZZZZ
MTAKINTMEDISLGTSIEGISAIGRSKIIQIAGRKHRTLHAIMLLIPNMPGIGSPA